MPIPRRWWKPSPFVEEFQRSRLLVKFRSMNSGLGNRDGFRSVDATSQDDRRITTCPLCLNGRNDEIHLLLSCSSMERMRRTIQMSTGKTLEYTLSEIRTRYSCNSDQEVARFFLGQEQNLNRSTMVDRGLSLDLLVSGFYKNWSELRGRIIHQPNSWRPS